MKIIPTYTGVLLLAFCLGLGACAAPQPQRHADPKTIFAQAAAQEDAGDLDGAVQGYLSLWKAFPGHEMAPQALYAAASILEEPSPSRAIDLLERLITAYPETPQAIAARERLLLDYLNQKRLTQAATLFNRTSTSPAEPMWSLLGIKLISTLIEASRQAEALEVIATLYPKVDERTQASLLTLWNTTLPQISDPEDLFRLEKLNLDPALTPALHESKAALDLQPSGREDGQIGLYPASPGEDTDQTTALITNTVGVLVPLSGRWQTIGDKILKGVQLSSQVFTTGPTPALHYLIRDYASDESRIPGLIDELDREGQVSAIIGPIGENACDVACSEAHKRGIPTLFFAQAEREPVEEAYCFRNFITIGIQVQTLLEVARNRGISSFAILYPMDRFGTDFSTLFSLMAPDYGIEVVRTVGYSPQKVDFKNEVSALTEGLPEGGEIDFQAVLIPDTAINSAMIATYLPYVNIEGITLFGPSLWDSPDFVRIGGTYVENAIFVSGFFINSQLPFVQEFNDAFYYTFGYNPSLWEAAAFDTATILENLLTGEIHTRHSLRERIASLKDYPGVTGSTSFWPKGEVEKVIFVLTIKGGSAMEITP